FADSLGFREARSALVGSGKRGIREGMVGVQPQSLLPGFYRFLRLSDHDVFVGQAVEGEKVARIDFTPELAGLDLIDRFTRGILVISDLDIKLFLLTDVLSPFEGFPKVAVSVIHLAEIAGYRRQPGVGHGKVRIKFGRQFIVRK